MVLLILFPPTLVIFKSSSFMHETSRSSFDIVITFSVACCCLFLVELLLHPIQNMYQNSISLQSVSNCASNKCSFALFGSRMKKLRLFYSWAAICPENFRTRRLCHNSSHRSPKFIVLDLLERRLRLSFKIIYCLLMVLLWSWTKISSQQQNFIDDDDRSHNFLREHASYLML
jgi:hypothetical protein